MFFRILKNDLRRKKTMNVILFLFVILATMFMASSINNLLAITGAVEHFIDISKVPDYFTLAVTQGETDEIQEYIEKSEYAKETEVIDTFNVNDDNLEIVKSDSTKKKYEKTANMSIQAKSDNFMKVFDSEGNLLELKSGEVAFPKLEAEANELKVGDIVRVTVGEVTQKFKIVTLTKDVVFGSAMMSYKRMIISEEDFKKFENQEDLHYVKFYCVDYLDEEKFQEDWKQQNFNVISNVTKDMIPLCFMVDMLIAVTLMIVSICLILIAFLVLRFTIVFTLQEEYKEIGIMKAIGLKDAGIKSVYMIKYFGIAVVGAIVGFILSFPFGDLLLEQAIVNIVIESADQNFLVNVIAAIAIVGLVSLFCYTSTNKLKKFTAIDAIRSGSNGERYKSHTKMKLWKSKIMSTTFFMAVNDILSSFRKFIILGITFCIGTLLILLPLSIATTLKSEEIVKTFNLSPSDVYIDNDRVDLYMAETDYDLIKSDIKYMEDTLEAEGLKGQVGMEIDFMIPCYADNPDKMYSYLTMQAIGDMEKEYVLLEGKAPELTNEIIITDKTAKEMGVGIGDTLHFQMGNEEKEFIICGKYQSMVNLGYGFRVSKDVEIEYDFLAGVFATQIELEDMEKEEALDVLKEVFPDYKVKTAQEFIKDLIGGITDQLDTIMIFIVGVVLVINSLITILMMKTFMTKERSDIALLKSIGFKNSSVRKWQIQRILMMLVSSIILGTLLSKPLSSLIVKPIFGIMGANQMELISNPLETYVIYPLIIFGATALSAVICSMGVNSVDVKEVNNME